MLDDTGRDEHPLRGLAQALDSPADESAHALRELEVLLGVARLRPRRAAQHGLGLGEIVERLLDEERVAFGRGLDAGQLHRCERRLGQARDHAFHAVVGQTAEHDALGAAALQEPRQGGGERPA